MGKSLKKAPINISIRALRIYHDSTKRCPNFGNEL